MSDDGSDQSHNSKVGRLIAHHDLDNMPERLERYWAGEAGDRYSLRELATLFNEQLVRAAMIEAGMNPLDGEAANIYDLLTSEEVTSGARTRAERRLDREGVDVSELRDSFVSHQAIHTYLTAVREQEYEPKETDVNERVETVQRLISRTRSISESTVETLENTEDGTIGEFDVNVDVRVTCRDCNSRYDLASLIQRGGCEC